MYTYICVHNIHTCVYVCVHMWMREILVVLEVAKKCSWKLINFYVVSTFYITIESVLSIVRLAFFCIIFHNLNSFPHVRHKLWVTISIYKAALSKCLIYKYTLLISKHSASFSSVVKIYLSKDEFLFSLNALLFLTSLVSVKWLASYPPDRAP